MLANWWKGFKPSNKASRMTHVQHATEDAPQLAGQKRKASDDDDFGTERDLEYRTRNEDFDFGYDSEEIVVAQRPAKAPRPPLANLRPESTHNKRLRVLEHVLVHATDARPNCTPPIASKPYLGRALHGAADDRPTLEPPTLQSTRPKRTVKRPSYARQEALGGLSEDGITHEPASRSSGARRRVETSDEHDDSTDFSGFSDGFSDAGDGFSDAESVNVDISDATADDFLSEDASTNVKPKRKGSNPSNPQPPPKVTSGQSIKGTKNKNTRMISLIKGRKTKGLVRDLPPMHDIDAMMTDMTSKALNLGLNKALEHFRSRSLRVATMCSGTESPLLALQMIRDCLKRSNLNLSLDHLFSAEIEPWIAAYIERNFSPRIIFRDITEFIGITADSMPLGTNVYGARVPVPTDIDVLIAGTSCVDHSNLNKKRGGMGEDGESGKTSEAVLDFAKAVRPAILLFENVLGAPWDKRFAQYEEAGYVVAGVNVDTKDNYLPQTRQRGYMVCFDRDRMGDLSAKYLCKMFCSTMEQLKRPASSSFLSFLTPNDGPHTGTHSNLDEIKREIDWEKCQVRHVQYRENHRLGTSRPYSYWQESGSSIAPEHGATDWISGQPERVKDFMDIDLLRNVKRAKGLPPRDTRYTPRLPDISQNVDMENDSASFGIVGCLTPTGMPFLTNKGRPLTSEEKHRLQGLPSNRISFTTETEAQLSKLAGNAMSTTTVASALLSAIIAGYPLIEPPEVARTEGKLDENPQQIKLAPARYETSDVSPFQEEIEISAMLANAEKSARRCYCEGGTGTAKRGIQACRSCGHTTCVSCGGNPEHDYRSDPVATKHRSSPEQFIEWLRANLPLRLALPDVNNFAKLISPKTSEIHKLYLELLNEAIREPFAMQKPRRTSQWMMTYLSETSGHRLILVLDINNPRWEIFLEPPPSLPCNHPLREMLKQPVGTADVNRSLLDVAWRWRMATPSHVNARIVEHQPRVPTFWLRNHIPDFESHRQPKSLTVSVNKSEGGQSLCEITGTYELLPRCGTAFDSLYKRVPTEHGTRPRYLFYDADPVGAGDEDSFVFSTSMHRLHDGEARPVDAWLPLSWRPWNSNRSESTVHLATYEWAELRQSGGIESIRTLLQMSKLKPGSTSDVNDNCKQNIRLATITASANYNANDQLSGPLKWLAEALRRNIVLNQWKSYTEDEVPISCPDCAPSKPMARWRIASMKTGLERYEDPSDAARYEKSHKSRPVLASVLVENTAPSTSVSLTLNLHSLAHRARAQLPPRVGQVEFDWQLSSSAKGQASFSFRRFKLKETIGVSPYAGDLQMSVDLFPKQLQSLTWMMRQEQGKAYVLERVQEEPIEKLDIRVQMRARSEISVKGGTLADDPGFGKTILSLALIQSQFLKTSPERIVDELKIRRQDTARGLLTTAATLIICPRTLVPQWASEVRDKLQYKEGVIAVLTSSQLAKLSTEDFKRAKIVIVSVSLLNQESYIGRLAAFTGLPRPCSDDGRGYSDWLQFATERVPEHLKILEQSGQKELQQSVKRRYAADIKGDTFRYIAPSRRVRGKDYAPAGHLEVEAGISESVPKVLDTTTVGQPLLEMFYWNRIIVDEFHLHKSHDLAAVTNLKADKRWGLSGTPAIGDFYEVAQMAKLLGITLPTGSIHRGVMKATNARALEKDTTKFERFDARVEVPSYSEYARLHELQQKFLDTFVRQNINEYDDIKCEEHLVPVTLDLAHQTVYTELSMQLNTQDMKIRRSSKSKNTERELRMYKSVSTSATAEEALSKAAACFGREEVDSTDKGLMGWIRRGEQEVERLLQSLSDAIADARRGEPAGFAQWKAGKIDKGGIGDREVQKMISRICNLTLKDKVILPPEEDQSMEEDQEEENDDNDEAEEEEKPKKDPRELTSKVNTLAARLLVAERSLRFFQNVQFVRKADTIKKASKHCSHRDCTPSAATQDVAVGLCGHVICAESYRDMKDNGLLSCPEPGCSADMRDHHLFWRSKMTAIQLSPPPYGAKIEAAIKILRTVRRKGDQAILFVQFRTQLDELRIALQDVDINAAIIQGQSAQREIEAFRDPSRTGEELKTVIVLDSSAETAVGLNLQNANHVIFLSPLLRDQQYAYDATRTQAIGRARRPGQKKLIHVYHIFALGTIDVDVLEHRERRIDALTEQGAPEVAMPTVIRELIDEVGGDMKRARTDLVDKDENFSLRTQLVCEDGRFSLRPKSWLICAGAKTQANEEDTLRRKGRNRVPGWEDFSSLVKFSSRFTEDDD